MIFLLGAFIFVFGGQRSKFKLLVKTTSQESLEKISLYLAQTSVWTPMDACKLRINLLAGAYKGKALMLVFTCHWKSTGVNNNNNTIKTGMVHCDNFENLNITCSKNLCFSDYCMTCQHVCSDKCLYCKSGL